MSDESADAAKGGSEGAIKADGPSSLGKGEYNPVADAGWSLGQPVPYFQFAATLNKIEKEPSRLGITAILRDFLRSVIALSPEDLLPAVNLASTRLAPPHEGMELGIGDSILSKAIATGTGRTLAQVRQSTTSLGDLGLAAEESKGSQRSLMQPIPLTLRKVFSEFRAISAESGKSSQDKKASRIKGMLLACQ